MKVVLLKDFLGNKETDTVNVSDKRGNYLVRMKIAKLENDSYESSEDGTKGIVTRKTIEQADKQIKKLNKKK